MYKHKDDGEELSAFN